MKYLFDTDHIVFWQLRKGAEFAALTAKIAAHATDDFAFSVVSFHEQVLGAHTCIQRSRTPGEVIRGYELLGKVLDDYRDAHVLPFDDAAAATFESFRKQRIRIGTMDLRIAGIAQSGNWVLLTRNRGDFGKVPGLQIEDWTV